MPKVSICIPAYNNPDYLIRAIDSVIIQTFKDYEIIITDDTPSDILKLVVQERYNHIDHLHYYKNPVQLGSTANWNYAISLANTNLIKLLHHDDWFTDKNSLEEFITPFLSNPEVDFVFCQSHHYDNNKHIKIHKPDSSLLQRFAIDHTYILYHNFIISPSSTMYKKSSLIYDTNLTWLVDADFYAMYMKNTNYYYIPKPLININISQGRLTTACEENIKLLTAENIYLLNKYSSSDQAKQNILKYFRITIRNFSLYTIESFRSQSGVNEIPEELEELIKKLGIKDRMFDTTFRILRRIKRTFFGRY